MGERTQRGDLQREIAILQKKKHDLKNRILKCYRILRQQDNVGLFKEPSNSYYSFRQDIDVHPILKLRKFIMRLELEHEHISHLIKKLGGEVRIAVDVERRNIGRCSSGHSTSTDCSNIGYPICECSDHSGRRSRSRQSVSSRHSSRHSRASKRSKDSKSSKSSKGSKSSKSSKSSKGSRSSKSSRSSRGSQSSQSSQQLSVDCSFWELCHPPKRIEIIGVIVRVFPRSPGHKAGVRPGDFIVEFGEINPHNYNGNPASLIEYAERREHQRIKIKIFRGGKISTKRLVPKRWDGCGLLGFRFGNVFK